jgi:hypothetical protein
MLGIPRENGVIKLRHKSVGRPIPELKDRCDQPDTRHIFDQPVLREQIEGCRMRRCCARIGL